MLEWWNITLKKSIYYWSCNIQKLLYWINNTTDDIRPAWVELELASSKLSLHSLVCSQLPLTATNFTSNPVVINTVKLWIQIRKCLGLHRASDLSPIVNNHLFLPSCTDLTFRTWFDKGMTKFKDLYNQGTFMSFSELSKKFDLPKSHLFRFFSAKAFYPKPEPQIP